MNSEITMKVKKKQSAETIDTKQLLHSKTFTS